MKRIYVVTFVALCGFLLYSFELGEKETVVKKSDIEYPKEVKAIIDKSCYACHHTDSKNEDGKSALDFDKLSSMKTFKVVGAMEGIMEVVEAGDMPPKKFLAKNPDKKLSSEEKDLLLKWAKKTADSAAK